MHGKCKRVVVHFHLANGIFTLVRLSRNFPHRWCSDESRLSSPIHQWLCSHVIKQRRKGKLAISSNKSKCELPWQTDREREKRRRQRLDRTERGENNSLSLLAGGHVTASFLPIISHRSTSIQHVGIDWIASDMLSYLTPSVHGDEQQMAMPYHQHSAGFMSYGFGFYDELNGESEGSSLQYELSVVFLSRFNTGAVSFGSHNETRRSEYRRETGTSRSVETLCKTQSRDDYHENGKVEKTSLSIGSPRSPDFLDECFPRSKCPSRD